MKIFNALSGQAIPLAMNDVDTDMIIPAQFLTSIERNGYGKNLFQRLRDDKAFIFNHPAYQAAQILVTKENFGCGSSREHAVWALMQAGIKVILAESYSDIFYNNAAKNGLLALVLSPERINELIDASEQEDFSLTVDLLLQTITTSVGERFSFHYDPFRRTCLLNGQDDLDYLLAATGHEREERQVDAVEVAE